MRIAFAGNPNSGKTTLYNALTGRSEHVGNWAGVTVDKKEAPIRRAYAGDRELVAVDLPGAYSMSPFTSEEGVTRDYIHTERPDVIVNIVDATNLSRSLFFTTQLLELGIPVVVALNKTDLSRKKTDIDAAALAEKLGCPVVETAAAAADHPGLQAVVDAAAARQGAVQRPPFAEPAATDRRSAEAADRKRYDFVNRLVAQVERRRVRTRDRNGQDALDAVLTNPIVGLPIFALVMFLVFQISQAWVGPWLADWLCGWIDRFGLWVEGLLQNTEPLLASLLLDGVIGGFSAVIGFLPLVMVMYFLISLLEDCGYMARATVVLDPIFKRVGLSGKSVIPFVVGTGCAIPGVMACRTIKDPRERRATALLAPFMPCGAKLPVIALFAGAFFRDASWVGTAMYFAGIALILLCALLIRRITGARGKKTYFFIELPEYKLPSLGRACGSMLSRGWSYIVKAGTVILLCNFAVNLMQTFTWRLLPAPGPDSSILASVARPVAWVLVPVAGIHAWQLAAAAVTGFIAKENVVGTLATCYGISNLIDTDALALAQGAGEDVAAVFGLTKAAALAYLMFNLFTPPCFAAIGAMNAELGSRKWLFAGIGLQLGVGYTVGYLVFTLGTLLTGGTPVPGAVLGGGLAVGLFGALLAGLVIRADRRAVQKAG